MDAVIVAPAGRGTCRAATGGWSTIDFAIMSKHVARGIEVVETVDSWPANPHVPVRFSFYEQLEDRWALAFKARPPIPTELPFGPQPREQDFSAAMEAANAAMDSAGTNSDRVSGAAQMALDVAYTELFDCAERHLIVATGAECKPSGQWGRMQIPQWTKIKVAEPLPNHLDLPEARRHDHLKWIKLHLDDWALASCGADGQSWAGSTADAAARLHAVQDWEGSADDATMRWLRTARAHSGATTGGAGVSLSDDRQALMDDVDKAAVEAGVASARSWRGI
jgi:hypothetical protein